VLALALALREAAPDIRLLFLLNLVTVLAVVGFAAGVVLVLQRRSYQRRAEGEKLAAMGTATARILHQIKNPLQTILLHAELLQDEQVVADGRARGEVCGAIVGEAQRLTAMLAELSVYASGASRELTLEPYPLNELVREVVRQEGREERVKIVADRLDETVVFADPYYLRQALDNLVSNAREAMEDAAESRITFRLERRGSAAELTVADNGPGIAADRLETLFVPFHSAKSKGMGLGLAICREIVEGHGGRVEVQSVVGEGTQFRIYLPLAPLTAESRPVTAGGGRG
jgi:signal transduction histidine kinase